MIAYVEAVMFLVFQIIKYTIGFLVTEEGEICVAIMNVVGCGLQKGAAKYYRVAEGEMNLVPKDIFTSGYKQLTFLFR